VVSISSGLADAQALSARLRLTPTESFAVLNGQDMMPSLRHTVLRDVGQMPCTEHTRSDMYLRLIDACITHLKAQGPSSICGRRLLILSGAEAGMMSIPEQEQEPLHPHDP